MLSFHGKQEIKDKYLNRVIAHREADKIIQGIGWEDGIGCAVGCTLENYDHSRYPIEIGLPEWLARLEDAIFENIPIEEAILWPEKFLSVIPIGVDVENIKNKLAILRLSRLIEIQKKLSEKQIALKDIFSQVISAIELIKKCHESEINKTYCDWSAARSAAWSAARSAAWSSGETAAWSAWSSGETAAWSAWSSGESAAWSAARSASWSAWSAARSAAWKQEAHDLLKLLSECK